MSNYVIIDVHVDTILRQFSWLKINRNSCALSMCFRFLLEFECIKMRRGTTTKGLFTSRK